MAKKTEKKSPAIKENPPLHKLNALSRKTSEALKKEKQKVVVVEVPAPAESKTDE